MMADTMTCSMGYEMVLLGKLTSPKGEGKESCE